MKQLIKVISFFLIMSFFLNISLADDQITLKQLKAKISSKQKELDRLEKEGATIVKKIEVLNDKLSAEKESFYILKKEFDVNNSYLKKLNFDYIKLNDKKKETQQTIGKIISYLLDNGIEYDSKAVFLYKDYREAITFDELIYEVNKNIISQIAAYNNAQKDLNNLKVSIEIENEKLLNTISKKNNIIKEYTTTAKELNKKIVEIEKNKAYSSEYLANLIREQEKLNNIINNNINSTPKIGNSNFSKLKGKLDFPLEGVIIESFGDRYIREAGITIKNKGIKIKPTSDGIVYSPANGTVVYSEYINGLDNVIIIQYDDYHYIVYANLDEFLNNPGEHIKKGESIGRVDLELKGDSAYLYIEIRYRDKAVNPIDWFNKNKV